MPERYTLNRGERARVMRQVKVNPDNGCWEWQGATNRNGYGWGQGRPGQSYRVMHRVLWEDANNAPVPDGLQLDHLCRNRLCCNPQHLEPVDGSTNTIRQDHANRRKTHCPQGHELPEERNKRGRRVCKTCESNRKSPAASPGQGAGP